MVSAFLKSCADLAAMPKPSGTSANGHGHDDDAVAGLGVLGDAGEGGLGHGVPEEEEKVISGSGPSTAGRSRRCFMLGPAAAVTGDDQAAAAGAREAAPRGGDRGAGRGLGPCDPQIYTINLNFD